MLERDVERPVGQRRSRWAGIGYVGGGVEQPDDPTPGRNRVLRLGEHLGRHLHRPHQQRDQERESHHGADAQLAGDAEPHPDHDHTRAGQSTGHARGGERHRDQPLGLDLTAVVGVDRPIDPRLGTRLDRVRLDHGRAHDRLSDDGKHVADAAPHPPVRGRHPPHHQPQSHQQRYEADPDDHGQLPGVEQHHDRRDDHLPDADHEQDPGELEEQRHLVDVAGDSRHQGAATFAALGQHRQVVHVPEGADPQVGQPVLAGDEEPDLHQVAGTGGQGHHHGRRHCREQHRALVDVSDQAPVDALLHDDGRDRAADGGHQREQHGAAQTLAQPRRQGQAAPERLGRAGLLSGAHGGNRVGALGCCRRAHGRPPAVTTTGSPSASCAAGSRAWSYASTMSR